jgi:AcrR family transcriptional regulator
MHREKRETKGAKTRARLIAAAGDALIEGRGDFEMSQLARRAGVSDGLPYHSLFRIQDRGSLGRHR